MEEKITAWVARDSEYNASCLHLFYTKPVKSRYSWQVNEYRISYGEDEKRTLNFINFPEVRWEDEEPTKVELTIKICE